MGTRPRTFGAPQRLLPTIGIFDSTVAGAADIGHLWTDPVLLGSSRYESLAGAVPCTPLQEGIQTTLDWVRSSDVRLQA